MKRQEDLYWLALSRVKYLGPVKCFRLLKFFGSAEKIWSASPEELQTSQCLDKLALGNLLAARAAPLPEDEWEKLQKQEIRLLTLSDDAYPLSLLQMPDPPPLLYVKGEIPEAPALAIVGSRKATFYGLGAAEQLANSLAAQGITIISGLARGIDTAAHKGALKSGKTVAVLGCGLDIYYPPENKALYQLISERGGLISEFPLGTKPDRVNFPRRNRIISGLANGVLLVEAAEKSGSLITADYALEQGKEVFAVPGMITSRQSCGTNRLIQEGAKLVQRADDILTELGIKKSVKEDKVSLSSEEKLILSMLLEEAKSIEELTEETNLTLPQVYKIMADLERKSCIIKLSNNKYTTLTD